MPRLARVFAVAATILLSTHTAPAQKHLKFKSKEDQQEKYAAFLRKVFSRIYRDDVVLSVVCVPSFIPEDAGGIFKTPRGYEAFSITLSASVWSTEYHSIIRSFDMHNREIRWKPADNTKVGLPVSYRDIKTRIRARPISAELAERIQQLWQGKAAGGAAPAARTERC